MGNAALMPATREFGVEEGCNAGLRHVTANEPRPERDDICIIVLTGELGREWVVNTGTAALEIAIDRNRDTDAAAADGNSPFGFTKSDKRAELCSKFRIIHAFRAVRPKIRNVVALLAEPLGKFIFEGIAGVVGGKGDAHVH